ncbi:hypothetical protein CSUI_010419 [Cystoisospora suis]|uniref:Transmembrane protein n=1 Tax=Cystoisospora suis TaxID=483139 RepID=A0A2C6JBH1_9APIC|nr:hypothetical protein CSUI_010419 [Cystoisospora suis]
MLCDLRTHALFFLIINDTVFSVLFPHQLCHLGVSSWPHPGVIPVIVVFLFSWASCAHVVFSLCCWAALSSSVFLGLRFSQGCFHLFFSLPLHRSE